MIKGVSRYAVEIDSTNNPFFERVICFVRPQYAGGNVLDLHREAARIANHISAGVEEAQNGPRHVLRTTPSDRRLNADYRPCPSAAESPRVNRTERGKWWPMLLSAGGGAAAALLLSAIF